MRVLAFYSHNETLFPVVLSLYESVGILLTCGKRLHDRII